MTTPARVWLISLALLAVAGARAAPELGMPVDCAVPAQCIVQNYVDTGRGAQARDFTCARLTYDGHRGVDFRVKRRADYTAGVVVTAAAPGKVRAIRDGMPDSAASEGERYAQRKAGNAVAVRHGDGWETQYSHLRRDSVRVQPGERVQRGQPLGVIGLSGNTEFPHLHFSVRHDGNTIDPYTGRRRETGCGAGDGPLWAPRVAQVLTYRARGLLGAGFVGGVPDGQADAFFAPELAQLERDSPVLVFWARAFGIQSGDRLEIELRGPDDTVLARSDKTFERSKAQHMSYIGKRRPGPGWPSGPYTAQYRLIADDRGEAGIEETYVVDLP